nr:hypothetical protein CFP56_76867 [Quercus suber]
MRIEIHACVGGFSMEPDLSSRGRTGLTHTCDISWSHGPWAMVRRPSKVIVVAAKAYVGESERSTEYARSNEKQEKDGGWVQAWWLVLGPGESGREVGGKMKRANQPQPQLVRASHTR